MTADFVAKTSNVLISYLANKQSSFRPTESPIYLYIMADRYDDVRCLVCETDALDSNKLDEYSLLLRTENPVPYWFRTQINVENPKIDNSRSWLHRAQKFICAFMKKPVADMLGNLFTPSGKKSLMLKKSVKKILSRMTRGRKIWKENSRAQLENIWIDSPASGFEETSISTCSQVASEPDEVKQQVWSKAMAFSAAFNESLSLGTFKQPSSDFLTNNSCPNLGFYDQPQHNRQHEEINIKIESANGSSSVKLKLLHEVRREYLHIDFGPEFPSIAQINERIRAV